MKLNRRSLLVILAVFLVMLYLTSNKSSYEAAEAADAADAADAAEAADAAVAIVGSGVDTTGYATVASNNANKNNLGVMNAGTGLASSLLPREVASKEDFGQFAPDEILKGQNFLDPREQIGWPETIGGTLRNANQQVRSEPPNPKQPYAWNNSTIVPDLMQRKICT